MSYVRYDPSEIKRRAEAIRDAGPALLAALERCEELLSSITEIRSDLAEFQDGYLRQARAAIAKARGES